MNIKKILPIAVFAIVLFLLPCLSGCQPRARVRSATEKHYDLKGKVVAVEKDKHLVTVAHENIKDYMPGMTMPFIVGEGSAWVFEAPHEDMAITKEGPDTTSPASGESIGAQAGDEVPNYRLINQDGKAIHIHDYQGKVLLLTFIYTRCQDPGQCTLMSTNFATVDQELQKQPDVYQKTHLLSISFDPEYDTPKVLRSYGAAYTGKYSDENFAHWEFASGSADEVKGIAQFFGLRYYLDSSSGKEQVIHSLRTAVIAPDGKVVKVYREDEGKPEDVLKQMQDAVGSAKLAADKRG